MKENPELHITENELNDLFVNQELKDEVKTIISTMDKSLDTVKFMTGELLMFSDNSADNYIEQLGVEQMRKLLEGLFSSLRKNMDQLRITILES